MSSCGGSDDSDDSGATWFTLSNDSAAAPAAARAEMVLAMSEEEQADGGVMVKSMAQSAPASAAGAPGLPGPPGAPAVSDMANDEWRPTIAESRCQARTLRPSSSSGASLCVRWTWALLLDDVGESIDAIGGVAEEMGGWLVSSSHAEEHFGFVSVRVPAERLEEAIQRLRGHGAGRRRARSRPAET